MLKLAALSANPCHGQEIRKLRPIDQSASAPDLRKLIGRMRIMVTEKDSRALEALMLPTFQVEFDSGKGPLAFRKRWMPDQPDTALWDTLGRALALGGTFYSKTVYAVPYVYTHFPLDCDPLSHVVVVGTNVAVLEKPEAGATVLAKVSDEILPLAKPMQPPVLVPSGQYLALKLPEFSNSFVESSGVYSPAGHRLFFEKRAGKWQWISFAAPTMAVAPDLLRLEQRLKR